jgi:dTDP-4-dehydrorhamnose 3,5-epimerase
LSEENRAQLWIPEGFAHGFLALREGTEVLYKATALYDATRDRSICWADRGVGITWPMATGIRLSARDTQASGLTSAELL